MSKYILDISTSEKPPWWREGDPVYLPLVDGQHDYEFDLVEDELPPEMVERAYECLINKYPTDDPDESIRLPIGVNRDAIIGRKAKVWRVKG